MSNKNDPFNLLGLSESETKRYSITRAIRAAADPNARNEAGFELECHRELEKRFGAARTQHSIYVPVSARSARRGTKAAATGGRGSARDLTASTGSAGGYLVGTQNLGGSFIDMVRARLVVRAAGAVTLPGLVGNITVPRQETGATAYWLANEATAITESQATFGQVPLTPKHCAAYSEVSMQLLKQSNPAADMIVQNDLALTVATAVDAAAFNGSGAAGQPTGVLNTVGIGTFNGTTMAYVDVLSAQGDVIGQNAAINPATLAYITTPTVAGLLAQRQRFTNTDSPVWAGGIVEGTVAGFRALASTNVPAATMVFGDFSQMLIGEWGQLQLDVNPYAAFTTGIIGVRAWYTVDIMVRQAKSFTVATSIT